MREVVDDRRGG